MSTVPDLPIELHAEILLSLHHYRDRRTLLSTALVNTEWRRQSQRVLFSKMTDHEYYSHKYRENVLLPKHMDFLRTIAEHPHRLGPLVVSYAQYALAFNMAATQFHDLPKPCSDLWELTARALPAMTNLKHLFLVPCADRWPAEDNWLSSSALLNSLTFRLQTLIWGCSYHPDNGFPEFLQNQHDIRHLQSENIASLAEGVCPRLISISGGFDSLSHVARSRRITAWRLLPGTEQAKRVAPDSTALSTLKYLSVYDYKIFRNTVGPIDLNIILLELTEGSWQTNTFSSLANMPRLRVLVFNLPKRRTIREQKITEKARKSFKGLPSLEYIIRGDYRENGDGYRYLKLIRPSNSADDSLQQELTIDYNIGAPWWTVYNV